MQYFNFDSMPKIVTYSKTLSIINSAYFTRISALGLREAHLNKLLHAIIKNQSKNCNIATQFSPTIGRNV